MPTPPPTTASLALPPGIEKVGSTIRVGHQVHMNMATIRAIRPYLRADEAPVSVRVEVNGAAAPPSAEVRRGIESELLDPSRVLAVAFVHSATGLRAALVRGVLQLLTAGRAQPPLRVFDDLQEAQTWLDHQHALHDQRD